MKYPSSRPPAVAVANTSPPPSAPDAHAPQPAAAQMPAGAFTLANHPLVYLNVPKSACTTIKNQMYFMEHGRYIDEPLDIHNDQTGLLRSRQNTPEVQALFEQRLRQRRLVFTFVRHPGRRAYSCFSEKIFHESKYSFVKVRDYIVQHHGLALPAPGDTGYDVEQHRRNFLCFLDFVRDNFAGKTPVRSDAHWGRQSGILRHFQRYFFIDMIGRVENFESQFTSVLDQTPMRHRPDLSVRFNEGPKPPFSYEQVVDAEVAARLHELYTDDYERLGYAGDAA